MKNAILLMLIVNSGFLVASSVGTVMSRGTVHNELFLVFTKVSARLSGFLFFAYLFVYVFG